MLYCTVGLRHAQRINYVKESRINLIVKWVYLSNPRLNPA